jgi:anaerobic magnesium-protoporphyrin IX monomethyl ester cyclase
MVDVLVAHSYFLQYDPKQLRKMRPYPPLGTLYAASILREAGLTVALFDAMFADDETAFQQALVRHRPRYVVLFEDSFHFLVKMCLSRMREAAHTMTGMARAAGATVMAAGPDVTDRPESYLAAGAEYALIGEADHTVRELVERLRTGNAPRETLGIAYLEADVLKRTLPRQPERSPDRFPFPAWDLADFDLYRSKWVNAHGHFSLNMVSTRGCPYHCNWCAKPIWGQQYAMRSPGCVAEEMALLKKAYRPDHIWFTDDIFGLRPTWIEQFADEVEALDARVPFTIQTRVDRMTPTAVSALARAGCREVWLGAESGSQKILDAMEKGTRLEEIGPARARLKSAGIRVGFFIQFGYPGETLEDINCTVAMVRDCMPDEIGVSVSYPLPGTRFHDRVRAQLSGKTHWTDSGDLAMMFRGTYRSAFYRELHKALHRDLDLRHRLKEAAGQPGGGLLEEISEVQQQWFELGRLEVTERNPDPTILIVANERLPAPDLSKAWS